MINLEIDDLQILILEDITKLKNKFIANTGIYPNHLIVPLEYYYPRGNVDARWRQLETITGLTICFGDTKQFSFGVK